MEEGCGHLKPPNMSNATDNSPQWTQTTYCPGHAASKARLATQSAAKWHNVLTRSEPGGGRKLGLVSTNTCVIPNQEVPAVPKVPGIATPTVRSSVHLTTGSRSADSMPPTTSNSTNVRPYWAVQEGRKQQPRHAAHHSKRPDEHEAMGTSSVCSDGCSENRSVKNVLGST